MIFWLVGWLLVGVATSSKVSLRSAARFIALSSDVTVVVGGASGEDTVELYYEDERALIAGQIIPQVDEEDDNDVTIVFNCGYFSRLGDYKFVVKRLRHKGRPEFIEIANTTITATKWPDIKLRWKGRHEAFSGDVKVSVDLPPHICQSTVASALNTKLVLSIDGAIVMATHDVNFPPISAIFKCDVFSRRGNYFVQLQMFDDVIVARSDVMLVEWSREYSMEIPEVKLPCRGKSLHIFLGKPPCAPSNDVIQVVTMYNDGRHHVISNATVGTSDSVSFSCSEFLAPSPGICFRYMTSHNIMRTACRPILDKRFNVDGGWSAWTHWNTCVRPCNSPIYQRKRSCDNPRPRGRGSFCSDKGMTSQYEVNSSERSNDATSCPSKVSRVAAPNCSCGCSMFVFQPKMISSPVVGGCDAMDVVSWKIFAPPNYVIRVNVIDLQLHNTERLLLSDELSRTQLSQLGVVTSEESLAELKYIRATSDHVVDSCGFTVVMEPVERNHSLFTTPPTRVESKSWIDELVRNPVVVIAVSVCLLVVLVVLSVTLCKCRQQRHSAKGLKITTVALEDRLIVPPDGKSSSNVDDESERQPPIGENNIMTPQPPRAAYYLAQRQLQLMKKEGKENSSQVYTAVCMNDSNIKEQAALLFGDGQEKPTT